MSKLDKEFPDGWYVTHYQAIGSHPIVCRWCPGPLVRLRSEVRICYHCDYIPKGVAA